MGTRDPIKGEPFCGRCHQGDYSPCTKSHESWSEDRLKVDPLNWHDRVERICDIYNFPRYPEEDEHKDSVGRNFRQRMEIELREAFLAGYESQAAKLALDRISKLCGQETWDYPGEVVRDVQCLMEGIKTALACVDEGTDAAEILRRMVPEARTKMPPLPRDGKARNIESSERHVLTMPYPDNPGKTHYDGCYQVRGHHNCAVDIVNEANERIAKHQQSTEEIKKILGVKVGETLLQHLSREEISS